MLDLLSLILAFTLGIPFVLIIFLLTPLVFGATCGIRAFMENLEDWPGIALALDEWIRFWDIE